MEPLGLGLGLFTFALMLASMALAVLFTRELQRRQAVSAQLQRAERDMSNILHSIPSLVGSWDVNLYNRFGNQAHESWFGVPLVNNFNGNYYGPTAYVRLTKSW